MTPATPSTRPRNFTTWADFQIRRLRTFVEEVGDATLLAGRTIRTMFTTRFDTAEFIYQLEQLGVRSLAIAAATAISISVQPGASPHPASPTPARATEPLMRG